MVSAGGEAFYRPSAFVVRAIEDDGFLIGVYGPFGSSSEAVTAAERHNRNGVKTDVLPLWAESEMGRW